MDFSKYFYYEDGHLKMTHKRGKRSAGAIAGSIDKDGYIQVWVLGKHYRAHRIVWQILKGSIPEGLCIDHINHDRTDNRIENLRLVKRQTNQKNMSRSKANTSGVTGVYWNKKDKRWQAYITVNKKMKSLGQFSSFDDAVKARKSAEVKFNFHENHGK